MRGGNIPRAPARLERKGSTPARVADGAARADRDAAQLDRYTSTVPGPTEAARWQELVGAITVSPAPPAFGAPATVTCTLTERAVKLHLGGKTFLVAVGGSVSASASLSLSWPDPPKPHVWR